MNRYELVLLVDTRLPQESMMGVIENVEKMLGTNVRQKDDIGMLDLAYGIEWNNRAYFVSYDVNLDPTKIIEFKRTLSLTKGLLRFSLFKMAEADKFLLFSDVNKAFELSEDEKVKQDNEKAFQDMDSWSKRKGKSKK